MSFKVDRDQDIAQTETIKGTVTIGAQDKRCGTCGHWCGPCARCRFHDIAQSVDESCPDWAARKVEPDKRCGTCRHWDGLDLGNGEHECAASHGGELYLANDCTECPDWTPAEPLGSAERLSERKTSTHDGGAVTGEQPVCAAGVTGTEEALTAAGEKPAPADFPLPEPVRRWREAARPGLAQKMAAAIAASVPPLWPIDQAADALEWLATADAVEVVPRLPLAPIARFIDAYQNPDGIRSIRDAFDALPPEWLKAAGIEVE